MGWVVVVLSVLLFAAQAAGQCSCPGDNNGDGMTTVDEIVASVNAALVGCPIAPRTPTQTRTPTATRTPTQPPQNDVAALIGTWTFETTIISTFFDHYRLDHVEVIDGDRILFGTDLDSGDEVFATYDPEFELPFSLLDPGPIGCDFYVFDFTGPNRIEGETYLTNVSQGVCSGLTSGRANQLIGNRTSGAFAPARLGHGERKAEAAALSGGAASQPSWVNAARFDRLRALQP